MATTTCIPHRQPANLQKKFSIVNGRVTFPSVFRRKVPAKKSDPTVGLVESPVADSGGSEPGTETLVGIL